MRAREPELSGFIDHDGVKIAWDVYGDGDVTLLLLPTWTIVHSRFWKGQIAYLARHCRVVAFDGPGNGRSDRPLDTAPYGVTSVAAMALGVLDATGTERAVVLSLSKAANWSLALTATHPDRVMGQVFVAPALSLAPPPPNHAESVERFWSELDDPQGWDKMNAHHWRTNYADFREFFFEQCLPEPHSTKAYDDLMAWSGETTPEVLIAETDAEMPDAETLREWCAQLTSPALVIHGTEDMVSPIERGRALAAATGADLLVLEGSGHVPLARDPVRVNLAIKEFVDRLAPRQPVERTWTRARSRRKRVLYVSSPIGLGHARRDLATVQALRTHEPDVHVEWLAQDPVTTMLGEAGEHVHPASRHLASESGHVASQAGEHDLHVFEALRTMDEILLANFMLFQEVVTETDYDLVVADEAWDVDFFLHENPELKRFAYAWSTDFVGFLPMPDADSREREVTADYNAEMIHQIARNPRVRDLSQFIGTPDDIVEDRFGPDLPMIRAWTEAHYTFPGYVTGFDPRELGDRDELRARLGYRPDEQVCIATVGGSGVGRDLLMRVIEAFPRAAHLVPGLRMVLVAGPRIDPSSLPQHEGLEVVGYVKDLHEHLAACDLAIVQGGLTTCMELTAAGTPFVYLPLRHHFEQHFHVDHRLRNHRAGRRLDYEEVTPDRLAEVIASEIGRDVDYAPVQTDGAERAGANLATLI